MDRDKPGTPRQFMEMAIEVMKNSIAEPRDDGKTSPKVGVVLVKPNGQVETAFRGELREGDHAEFTIIERKNRDSNLSDSILFATLEPCAPGARRHPKLGCAERIANARIKEVWIGIEDPDPDVDRKGIKYLQMQGIKVHMFDRDLQKIILEENSEFLKQAKYRAASKESPIMLLSDKEKSIPTKHIDSLSKEAIELYINKSGRKLDFGTAEFWNHFESIGMVERIKGKDSEEYNPTGFGIILFGKEPRVSFPQSVVKAKVKYGNDKPIPQDFDQPLVMMPYEIETWLRKVLHSKSSRESFERKDETIYPIEPLREAIINAIAHRNYDIDGAKTYIEIDDNKIVIRSAGMPVDPISLEQIQNFNAPSLSRNPKITFVLNQMKLMEEAELGMDTFRSMRDDYNLPLPVYSYNAPYLTLTFARSADAFKIISDKEEIMKLNEEELKGLDWIKLGGEVTKKDYAEHFGYDDKKAQRHLSKLRNLGLIRASTDKIKSRSLKYVYSSGVTVNEKD